MKDDLKDLIDRAGNRAKRTGKRVARTFADDETVDSAKETAKDTARDVEEKLGDVLADVGDEAIRILQSPEVERALDTVGDVLKGWARTIREQRDEPAEE